MFIAGIDGGGSHTRLEIRDMENHPVRREEFGPFNINSIGPDAFRELLREVFAACGGLQDCASLCLGGAGISNPNMQRILGEELKDSDFRGALKVCGDQEIALRGAMNTPGVVLIAGTGSICFGRNGAGETARCGGFGHLIDDGGSGYALGRDMLSAAARATDGRCDAPEILAAVYQRLGASIPGDIVTFVYDPATDKSAIAQFAGLALDLARAGSREAIKILERNAAELCDLVAAVQNRLNLHGCPIALLGGLLTSDNPYRHQAVCALSRLGTVITPAHDALWGAAQMAWENRP